MERDSVFNSNFQDEYQELFGGPLNCLQTSFCASESRLFLMISVSAFSIGGKRPLLDFVVVDKHSTAILPEVCITAVVQDSSVTKAGLIMLFPLIAIARNTAAAIQPDHYASARLNTLRIHCSRSVNVVHEIKTNEQVGGLVNRKHSVLVS